MINLKKGIRVRVNGPEAENVEWKVYWTDGRQGFASWLAITKDLTDREDQGAICLHAEYSDHNIVENLTRRDLRYAKSLFIF